MRPRRFAGFEAPPAGGGSTDDRFRLFDAVARLLRQVTVDQPLVIVLDDAHWADPSSLLLLQHVARSMAGQRLLVVVNHRDTEPLHSVLVTELPRETATRELQIRGLTVPAVGRQLAAVPGRVAADSEAERVHARTGGNPFFVAEIGRVLADQPSGASASPVTLSVREAIGTRLGGRDTG